MSKNFIYGLPHSIDYSPHMDTESVYTAVGKNTGNLAFGYALWKQLNELPRVSWRDEDSHLLSKDSIGVLTLSNQLGSHTNMSYLSKAISKHACKLVGVGLGAQGMYGKDFFMPQETVDWVHLLISRAPSDRPNIGIRGEFTLSVLKKYNLSAGVEILGCPSLFINPNLDLGMQIKSRYMAIPKRIAVASGHPGWTGLSKLENSLAELCTSANDYFVQSPISMIQLARDLNCSIDRTELEAVRRYARPNLSLDQFNDWRLIHATCFFSASAWMEHIKKFDFVVGLRIHGVMLAIQMGIPALCIAHDSRTKELCETMMIPHVDVNIVRNGISREDLVNLSAFNHKLFDENRRYLGIKYVKFLRENKLEVSPYMDSFR